MRSIKEACVHFALLLTRGTITPSFYRSVTEELFHIMEKEGRR